MSTQYTCTDRWLLLVGTPPRNPDRADLFSIVIMIIIVIISSHPQEDPPTSPPLLAKNADFLSVCSTFFAEYYHHRC